MIRQLDNCVARGVTPLGEVLGAAAPQAWQQYADAEGQAPRSGGWFFYYHSHGHGARGEHGHFHVFARMPRRRGTHGDAPDFTHLVGVGVDARGLPLRLFTTNRWVTGETWRDAEALTATLERIVAAHPVASTPLERWLRDLLALFAPQVALLLAHRDRRVAAHGGQRVFEDRRMHVLSDCRVSLGTQMSALDVVAP